MVPKKIVILLAAVFVLGIPASLCAAELEVVGGMGNMAFDPELEQALGAGKGEFEPRHFPFGYLNLKGDFSEMIDFGARIERDPLLRTRIMGIAGLNLTYVRFEFGPVIGVFNTPGQILNAGIFGNFHIEYPGIIFGEFKGSSTLGSLAPVPGDYVQSTGEAALGFWVPNVICTLSISNKTFNHWASEKLMTKDELTRYQFSADVFSKNVPYTIKIDFGFESLKRSYSPAGNSANAHEADELKALYLGFRGTWRLVPALRLVLGLEMPVYTWAEQPLKKPGKDSVLYQCQAGIIWNFRDTPKSED